MLGMSNEQWMGLMRVVLPALGTLFAALGFIKAADVPTWTDTAMQIIGPSLIAISAVWTVIKNKKANLINTVAAMPEVKAIHLEPTVAGAALASPAVTAPNVQVAR